MNENRIWELFAEKLSGEASENDLAELNKLIQEKPEISYALEILMAFWGHGNQGNERVATEKTKKATTR
jgi:hypothetical protein